MNPYEPPRRDKGTSRRARKQVPTDLLVYGVILLFVFVVLLPIMLVVYPQYY